MNPIYLLGATDRFNYGDLLFPHIITFKIKEYAINKGFVPDIKNYSLQCSDLTSIGAFVTYSYNEFYNQLKNIDACNVIILGGEVLGTNWFILYSFLYSFYDKLYHIMPPRIRNYLNPLIIRFLIRPQTPYPFVLNKKEIKSLSYLCYNSVGGMIYSAKELEYFNTADYISIRSKSSYNYFKMKNINTFLCPDSAILMSQIWPMERLSTLKKGSLVLPEKYIFFQINKSYSKGKIKQIIEILIDIYNQTKLPIVLCPIGLALGHEDNIPLEEINKSLTVPNIFISTPNLWDIMYAISHSKLYIGTSLHGVITAMSFNVPYIGLIRNNKISDYLETWAIDQLKTGATLETLRDQVIKIYDKDLSYQLNLSSIKMKLMVNESFHKICSKLK